MAAGGARTRAAAMTVRRRARRRRLAHCQARVRRASTTPAFGDAEIADADGQANC